MFFDELSDEEWTRVSTLIADEPIRLNRRGRPRAETRVVANAIFWILTTGEPWSKLPGRYPSGPTCRRRFEEWLASGTLGEMVAMLAELSGRSFAYVPPPPELATPAQHTAEPAVGNDRLRGVFWQNPESWRLPVAEADEWDDEDDERETQQTVREVQAAESAVVEARLAPLVQRVLPSESGSPALASISRQAEPEAAVTARELDIMSADRADDGELAEHARPVSVRFATVAPQSEPYRGYTLYGTAQPVQNMMYRAWAEIAQDGRRVERSGLIGPRFSDPEAAERHAIAWGRDWVDHQLAAASEPEAQVQMHVQAQAAAAAPLPEPQPLVVEIEPAPLPQLRTQHPARVALATLSTLGPSDRNHVRHFGADRMPRVDDERGETASPPTELGYREFAYPIG